MNGGVLKSVWRVCGICGIALLSWSFLKIQAGENTIWDCVWEILLSVLLLAAAFQSYRKWEAARPPESSAAKRTDRGKKDGF